MNILIARTAREIETAYQKLSRAKILGCDTETSSLSPRHGRIFSVQFSDGDFNVLIPLSEGIPMGKLEEILINPNITKIFHNARFDLEFLREKGFQTNNIFCTMIAEKLLTKGAGQSVRLPKRFTDISPLTSTNPNAPNLPKLERHLDRRSGKLRPLGCHLSARTPHTANSLARKIRLDRRFSQTDAKIYLAANKHKRTRKQ